MHGKNKNERNKKRNNKDDVKNELIRTLVEGKVFENEKLAQDR